MGNCLIDSYNVGPNVVWLDEDAWAPIPARKRIAVSGAVLYEVVGGSKGGRGITLLCQQQTKTKWRYYEGLLATSPPGIYTLTLPDARTFTVMFDMEQTKPVAAVPLLKQRPTYEDDDYFDITLSFFSIY